MRGLVRDLRLLSLHQVPEGVWSPPVPHVHAYRRKRPPRVCVPFTEGAFLAAHVVCFAASSGLSIAPCHSLSFGGHEVFWTSCGCGCGVEWLQCGTMWLSRLQYLSVGVHSCDVVGTSRKQSRRLGIDCMCDPVLQL